ncbi:MAG: transglutaminase-like domain-containing protein [Smithella sp.]
MMCLINREEKIIKSAIKKLLLFSITLSILIIFLASVGECSEASADYYATVAKWASYKDVYSWLEKNFVYDYGRKGRYGKEPLSPEEMFRLKKGACYDSANFVIDALNRINPEYKARSVFIKNKLGPPHHWVTAFTVDGKLFIMDYGTGASWEAMRGIHGPYKSLSEYEEFLFSLRIKGFSVDDVMYRDINLH